MIKLFEEYNSYYTELSKLEYDDWVDSGAPISFTNEYNFIRKMVIDKFGMCVDQFNVKTTLFFHLVVLVIH